MAERRFNEEEVAAIFERATQTRERSPQRLQAGGGMTLAQLQEIGRDVGIPAEDIAQAAFSVDLASVATERRWLGLPLGVGRTVELPRRLTDAEWERLVVVLRETFDARGKVRAEGTLRSWRNGNLQALLEPTARGHRLRLSTLNGGVQGALSGGLVFMGIAAVTLLLRTFGGPGLESIPKLALLVPWAAGVGMFAWGALRLPAWARLRRQQMLEIAERTSEETRAVRE